MSLQTLVYKIIQQFDYKYFEYKKLPPPSVSKLLRGYFSLKLDGIAFLNILSANNIDVNNESRASLKNVTLFLYF
jgi:hypothetical protein